MFLFRNIEIPKNGYFIILVFAFVVNSSLLLVEVMMGLDFSLHDDSREYVELAGEIIATGSWLQNLMPENGFPFIVASSIYLFNSLMPVMGLVFILGALIPLSIARLLKVTYPETAPISIMLVGFVVGLMPYVSHLSLFLLKDVVFIWLSIEFFVAVRKESYVAIVVFAVLMVWIRNYIGAFNIILGFCLICSNLVTSRMLIFVGSAGSLVMLYMTGLLDKILQELIVRGDKVYVGREFFSDLLTLRIDGYVDLFYSLFISPFKNLVLPNAFLVENKYELLYSINTSLMQVILILFLCGLFLSKLKVSREDCGLLIVVFSGFWFIDVAHPDYGAAVRYREFYLLLLVSYMTMKLSDGCLQATAVGKLLNKKVTF